MPTTYALPRTALCFATLSLALLSCSTKTPRTPNGYENLHGVLWTQHSAEHRALCRATFRSATTALRAALKDPQWTAIPSQNLGAQTLPPAVIVDVDETVIDNTPYQARLIQSGATFTTASWHAWAREAAAEPLSGAVEFARAAKALGVTMFYVTNRNHEIEAATRSNLRELGFPIDESGDLDVVLTRGEIEGDGSDKTRRRAKVASTHRVLLLLGDDLGDFLGNVKPTLPRNASAERIGAEATRLRALRHGLVVQHTDYWGRRWFVLPNSIYGSWERILRNQSGSDGKLNALRTKGR